MSLELIAIPAVVVAAIVLIIVAGRSEDGRSATRVDAIDDRGLRVGEQVAEWSSIFEVTVVTRRGLGSPWFGFEVRSETAGELVVDGGDDGLVEALLAQAHHLPGFNHATAGEVLAQRRGRAVCYRR